MVSITETITVTELARLTKKSRPTIYKWLTLYESKEPKELPNAARELFDLISGGGSKKDIYQFCEEHFFDENDGDELIEIFELLRTHREKIDLKKLKQIILEEINK